MLFSDWYTTLHVTYIVLILEGKRTILYRFLQGLCHKSRLHKFIIFSEISSFYKSSIQLMQHTCLLSFFVQSFTVLAATRTNPSIDIPIVLVLLIFVYITPCFIRTGCIPSDGGGFLDRGFVQKFKRI